MLAKTESSCTTYVEIIEYEPMKNENYKTVFLNICKEGKSNEVLKYSLKSIRKCPKSNDKKYADLIKYVSDESCD